MYKKWYPIEVYLVSQMWEDVVIIQIIQMSFM